MFTLEISEKGLFRLRFPGRCTASRPGLGILRHGLRRVALRFRGYFKHPRVSFASVRLDLTGYTPFEQKVYAVLMRVLAGKVISYGELAKRAGYLGAARAVGTAMKKNRLPIVIPCHRVVRSNGSLGQYSAGIKWKRWLLKHEGNNCV